MKSVPSRSAPKSVECVHCELPLRNKRPFTYPLSGATAHYTCVSQPSAAEMDQLLLARVRAPQKKKYAYSTG